jgi:large subunit ribosomal protein L49
VQPFEILFAITSVILRAGDRITQIGVKMALGHTFMSLLRPMALPLPSTLNHFLGAAKLTTTSSTATSATLPSPTTTASQSLPYKIIRTPSQNLPVYLLAKRGGNLKQTRLRKIEGNINVLRTELQEALGLEEKEVVINQLTRQIIIKGWKKPQVTKFLAERQF